MFSKATSPLGSWTVSKKSYPSSKILNWLPITLRGWHLFHISTVYLYMFDIFSQTNVFYHS
jgi:hypothetical protein